MFPQQVLLQLEIFAIHHKKFIMFFIGKTYGIDNYNYKMTNVFNILDLLLTIIKYTTVQT